MMLQAPPWIYLYSIAGSSIVFGSKLKFELLSDYLFFLFKCFMSQLIINGSVRVHRCQIWVVSIESC